MNTGAYLAYLDIVVVRTETCKVLALADIEESVASPTLQIGDLLATLLGDQIASNQALDNRMPRSQAVAAARAELGVIVRVLGAQAFCLGDVEQLDVGADKG